MGSLRNVLLKRWQERGGPQGATEEGKRRLREDEGRGKKGARRKEEAFKGRWKKREIGGRQKGKREEEGDARHEAPRETGD